MQKIVDACYKGSLFAAIKNCDLEGIKLLVHDDVNKKNCYDGIPIEEIVVLSDRTNKAATALRFPF